MGEAFEELPDPRDRTRITYPTRYLVWMALLLFVFRLGARRRLDYALRSETAVRNLNRLAGTSGLPLARSQTVANLVKGLPFKAVRQLPAHIVRRLRRQRLLDKFRLQETYHRIAIDATGLFSFPHRHCPHCQTTHHSGGGTTYQHSVLEARLLLGDAAAISIDTEFIQNTDGREGQDHELAAFQRLIRRLRDRFPRLPICLLLDAEYLCEAVMELCEAHRLRYIITFKEGRMPERWREFQNLLQLAPDNKLRVQQPDGTYRLYRWIPDITHKGHSFNAVHMIEIQPDGQTTRFAWATNLKIDARKVQELCLRGGRARWTIENKGFGRQKTRGFGLQHPYCEDWQGARNFYILLQLADAISQLLEASNLLDQQPEELFGSRIAFAARLLEAWRTWIPPGAALREVRRGHYQVRIRGP